MTKPDPRKLPRRIVLALAVLVAIAGGLACLVADQVRAARRAENAREAFRSGSVEEAGRAIELWRQARPKSTGPRVMAARLAWREGNNLEASEILQSLRRGGASGEETRLLEALLQSRTAQPALAEATLKKAWDEAAEPDIAEALAKVYLETFRLGAARDVIDAWAKAVPDDPRPWLWRTEIDGRLDDPARVILDYEEALKRDPERFETREKLAEALLADGRLDRAAEEFGRCLDTRPDSHASLLGAARVALQQARWDDARVCLDRGIGVAPDQPGFWLERGNWNLARGQAEAARSDLERAIELDPHDPEARRRLVLALSRLGRADDAQAQAKEMDRLKAEREELIELRGRLARSPDDREAQVGAARWLIAHDHAEEGLRWARKVLGEDPANAAIHELLSTYYEKIGDAGLANYHRLQLRVPDRR